MSDKDLRNMYEAVVKGTYIQPVREQDLYREVYTENRPATGVDAQGRVYDIDGQPRDREGTALVMDEQGMWRSFRIAKSVRLDLIDELEGMKDRSNLIDEIKIQAKSASIIEDVGMSSFRDVIVNLRDFIMDSAKLTKDNQPENQDEIPVIAGSIMQNIKDFEFQQQLVNFMNSTDKQKEFNLFDIVGDVKGQTMGVYFDIANNPHMKYMMPAGEDVKARGAAGPGEALLSFIYNGEKPKGAGDILLGRKSVVTDEEGKEKREDYTIELKYNQGRIGKNIHPSTIKKFPKLFTADVPTYHRDMGARFAGVEDADSVSNKVHVFPQATGDNVYATKNQIVKSVNDYNVALEAASAAVGNEGEAVEVPAAPVYNQILQAMETVGALKTLKSGYVKHVLLGDFILKKTEGTPGFEEGFGVLSDQRARAMTLDEFVLEYTGIEKGDKSTAFNLYGNNTVIMPGETIENILKQLDGAHDKHRLENLVGSIHIKNYLTHIEPFTWLVVYDQYGSARSIRHEEIVNLDVISLIDIVHKNGLKFGPRTDGGGYDLRFL